MKRVLCCLLALGQLAVSGCDILFPPGSSPNPNPIPGSGGDIGGPVRVLIEYQIDTIASRADIGNEPQTFTTSIGSIGDAVYEGAAHTLTCDTTATIQAASWRSHWNTIEE